MAEEQKNSASQMLEKGASAAHAVRGAVKAGKAIASASKGAAVAGPYGAAAGALWAGRKYIGKIILVMVALLLLPVMFLLMLPGLIFGGFSDAYSTADPNAPILNSEAAIMANVADITFSINTILGEGMTDAEERIAEDFALTDGDCVEIINPYTDNPVYNANLFVSQYSAYKNEDYTGISLADMEQILRSHEEKLYSYTRTEEMRERPKTEEEIAQETEDAILAGADPDDIQIDPTVTEKWMVYTLVYNGEDYFADQIFALNDEQKALAGDYAYNLSLFLGDGLLQNLAGWDGSSIPSLGDVSFTDGATEVVYYNQLDERYAGKPYGTDVIGGYGCGPTAMAIVVSSLAGETVDPVEMAQWSYENGYWCKNSGSYHALIPAAAKNWNLPVSGCTASEPQRILDALADGKLVVAIMGKGHFTSSGHFIVLRGVKDGQILVADPASYTRSGQTWDLTIILNEASKNAGSGGPFWIIG